MAGLSEALVQAREKLLRYRGSLIGEQNTKAVLIEPILRALGWDLEDLDEVLREYRRKPADNPVDYALLILRTPRLFVEAKGLSENLDDRRWASQIMGYAAVAGVEWVVLTNGDEYRIYNSHTPVPVEEKLFRAVCLAAEDSRAEETLSILSKERMKENWIDVLWKAHFVDRQIRAVIEGLFSADADPALVRLIARRVPTLTVGDIKAALARLRIHLDFPMDPVAPTEPPSPERFRPLEGGGPADTALQADAPRKPGTPWRDVSLQNIISAGLIQLPLELKKTYLGRQLTARVEPDGRIICLGQAYDSISTSAGMARASVTGVPSGKRFPSTNGWTFWRFRDSDGELKSLDELRQRYLRSGVSSGS